MSWSTAVADLRVKLSDGPTDKLRAFKRVIGEVNGVNKVFKTFEFRRVSNFTTASSPVGVWLNQSLLATTAIASDDPATGFFTLVTAPTGNDVVEATYYTAHFIDSELQEFLRLSCNWLLTADDYSVIPEGLRPAALQYAMADAYGKLAMRFAEHLSETYRLEDTPDAKRFEMVAQYKDASKQARETAHTLRDEYYKRQGQHLSPLYGTAKGSTRTVGPNR